MQTRHLHQKPKSGFVAWYQNLWSKKKESEHNYEHVVQVGDPILRTRSQPVAQEMISEPRFQELVSRMKLVLEKYDSIGLSAVQVGIPCQMFVIQFTKRQLSVWEDKVVQESGMKEIPFQVLINPKVKVLNNTQVVDRESCTSVYGFSALVPRAKEILVESLNENGEQVTFKAKDWTARLVQHEMDHLSGKLFTDRMEKETLIFNYWNVVNHKRGDFRLSYNGIHGFKHTVFPLNLLKQRKS